jgi:hypothetical protein
MKKVNFKVAVTETCHTDFLKLVSDSLESAEHTLGANALSC